MSSSNLTSTAGYSTTSGAWQNEELGVHLAGEPAIVEELAGEFDAIWAPAHRLSEATVGLSLDGATSAAFRVACMRAPAVGSSSPSVCPPGRSARSSRSAPTTPTVPAEGGDTDALLGLRGGGGGRRSQVPDVETLFAHPSKSHAFLMAQTFVRSSATYHVADVTVVRSIDAGGAFTASMRAVETGEIVASADAAVLDRLLSGDLAPGLDVGHLPANPAVQVRLAAGWLLTLHTAVLGMTGAGKSNAVRVIVDRLLAAGEDLRVVIVDTHGEYGDLAADARTIPCASSRACWTRTG